MIKEFARVSRQSQSIHARELLRSPYLGTLLLLMVATVSLSMGLAVLADEAALVAYYALVGGARLFAF